MVERSDAVIIDWRHAISDISERNNFTMIEVRLLRLKQAGGEPRDLRVKRFSVMYCDLTTIEHQIAELGFVPVLRGPDGVQVRKESNGSPLLGCLTLLAFLILVIVTVLYFK